MSEPSGVPSVEDVLAAHRHPGEFLSGLGDAWLVCSCGERIDLPVRDHKVSHEEAARLFEVHQATALASVLSEARAEAWDAGWCVGASNVFVMAGDRPLPQVNPYRTDEQKCPDFVLIDGNEWHCILPGGHDDGPNSCDHDRRRSVPESEGQ